MLAATLMVVNATDLLSFNAHCIGGVRMKVLKVMPLSLSSSFEKVYHCLMQKPQLTAKNHVLCD